MKKLVFIFALCFVAVSFSFAQKKAITAAKNELKNQTRPNIGDAREFIQEALANPETENDPEAWYVAGVVENKQFDVEKGKEFLGMEANEDLMYPALDKILPYFLKADELDQLPDEKGKVKLKFRKDIKSVMSANRPYYINAGSYFYEKQDYQKAYENFRLYGDMAKLPFFVGDEKRFSALEGDTNAIKIRYFAALSASAIPNHEAAIELFEEIKDLGYSENDIYKNLVNEYSQIKDTVKFAEILELGVTKFPEESYYILNLINLNINRGEIQKSIDYIQQAIASTPDDPKLYDVLGLVYESGKDIDKAIESIKKALEIDPEYAEALSHLGRLYYNLGVETRGAADNILDNDLFQKESEKATAYFKQSLPYFEKAYALDPDDSDAVFAMRNIYYSLGMNDEYEKMDKIYLGQ